VLNKAAGHIKQKNNFITPAGGTTEIAGY
jgi:hypothetical protein